MRIVGCTDSSAPLQGSPGLRPGIFSAVPGGTLPGSFSPPRTRVLGYYQPSLAGLFLALSLHPGLASWATISRPFGTGFSLHITLPALRGADYSHHPLRQAQGRLYGTVWTAGAHLIRLNE